MKLDELSALKNEIQSKLIRHQADLGNNTVQQSIPIPRSPEYRIAFGHSLRQSGDYQLEIRVQKSEGLAHRVAREVESKAGMNDQVHIEVIPRIQIPPRTQIAPLLPPVPHVNCAEDALRIGLSIGHKNGGAGTLGAFLDRGNNEAHLLSCSHVIANMGDAEINDYVYHPGREVGSGIHLDATRRIARLSNFIDLSRDNPNEIDAAIAQLMPHCAAVGTRIPVGMSYPNEGMPLSVLNDEEQLAIRDTIVCKIGRTTGYTRGMIRAVEFDNLVIGSPEGNLAFTRVIEVRAMDRDNPFSQPGDSGSLVFTEDGLRAFGLIFAGGTRDRDGIQLSYICRLDTILKWANAELLVD